MAKKIKEKVEAYEEIVEESSTQAEEGSQEPIKIKGAEDLSEESYKMKVQEIIPKYLLDEFHKVTGCECILDAASLLVKSKYPVSSSMQKALNRFYKELFNENVKLTACTSCMLRRMKRISTRVLSLGLEPIE